MIVSIPTGTIGTAGTVETARTIEIAGASTSEGEQHARDN